MAIFSAETTVRGVLTGSEGRPMAMAKVFLASPNDSSIVSAASAGTDGQYTISIPSTGLWILRFTGVAHCEHSVALLTDRPQTIRLNVQLGGYRYVQNFDKVSVVGNFNRWHVLAAVPMKKLSDSTFVAEIECDTNVVAYRLNGVRIGDSFEGTMADSYFYDASKGYVSLLNSPGPRIRILFDPGRLVRTPPRAVVSFIEASPLIAGFARIHDELQRMQDSYLFAAEDSMRSGRFRAGFSYDWSSSMSSIEEQIGHETDTILRQELYLNYLTIAMMARSANSALYTRTFLEISPASLVWSLNPHAIYAGLRRTTFTEAERDTYVRQVIETNPVARTKAALLFDEFMVAKLSEEKEKADNYFDILVDRFSDTPEAAMVRKSYSHQIVFREGKPVPAFSVVSIDDSTRTITKSTLKGKYYLLDFWDTKNEYSVKEREYLHAAYKKYRTKNFTILSLSVDESPQDAVEFRRGKWKMPWLNAYIGKNLDNKMLRDYNVITVPATFLVDPQGNFVAAGNALAGKDLAVTIKKYLGK